MIGHALPARQQDRDGCVHPQVQVVFRHRKQRRANRAVLCVYGAIAGIGGRIDDAQLSDRGISDSKTADLQSRTGVVLDGNIGRLCIVDQNRSPVKRLGISVPLFEFPGFGSIVPVKIRDVIAVLCGIPCKTDGINRGRRKTEGIGVFNFVSQFRNRRRVKFGEIIKRRFFHLIIGISCPFDACRRNILRKGLLVAHLNLDLRTPEELFRILVFLHTEAAAVI